MIPILIVDDSREDALLAQRILAQCKLRNPVHLLDSGQSCLDYFHGAAPFANRSVPGLVFLDMMMSPVSGLDTLRKLKSLRAATDSVFVMLSSHEDLRSVHWGYQLGARTFLMKPLKQKEIMQMLNSVASICVRRNGDGYEVILNSARRPRESSAARQHTLNRFRT